MGLELNTALFLKQAMADGCRFSDTATLGRQTFFLRGEAVSEHFPTLKNRAWERYAESFLRAAFDCETVTSFDASPYEQASVVHDMNLPVALEWHERFDAVLDIGSLEHIFHFPTAISNLMRMTKVGGRLFLTTPCNNHFGHGFYQFGPDLFFRLLSPANGFKIERMYVFEHRFFGPEMGCCGPWFAVRDPAQARCRPIVIGKNPMLLLVRARRVAAAAGVLAIPQQSDYSAMWTGTPTAQSTGHAAGAGRARGFAARFLKVYCAGLYRRIASARFRLLREGQRRTEHSLGNAQCFEKTKLRGDSPAS